MNERGGIKIIAIVTWFFFSVRDKCGQCYLCMSRKLHFLFRNPVWLVLCVYLCVHSAPVSSPVSRNVNRLKFRGSKGQRPLTASALLFKIWLEAYLKRIILEMPRPGNLIDLREAENSLAANDNWLTQNAPCCKGVDPLTPHCIFTEALAEPVFLFFFFLVIWKMKNLIN